jgi:hypothetical protein
MDIDTAKLDDFMGRLVQDLGAVMDAATIVVGDRLLICAPASRSQEVGLCLGAQAGEARLREVVTQGGFTQFRRAAHTPFNPVFEARP